MRETKGETERQTETKADKDGQRKIETDIWKGRQRQRDRVTERVSSPLMVAIVRVHSSSDARLCIALR